MEVIHTNDVKEYVSLVEPLLIKKEACNNLLLGIVNRLIDSAANSNDDLPPYLGLVKHRDEVTYAFIQTPPHNLILPDTYDIESNVMDEIAKYLYEQGVYLPGVIGPGLAAASFAQAWESVAKVNTVLHMRQQIYQLDKVNKIDYPEGKLVTAETGEQHVIMEWLKQFGAEANEPSLQSKAATMARKFVEDQSVYLWKIHNTPVSMVNQSRRTKHGVTINAVFTPDQYKRKGYATAAVATLSQQLLDSGNQFCSLYTDLDNATSNSIYKKIGFKPVGDSVVYKFE